MNITAAIAAVAPRLYPDSHARWSAILAGPMALARIDTPNRVAAFLGQAAHESAGFFLLWENLDYRAIRLCDVWPARFPNLAAAAPFERAPEKIANRVYANRLGNGDESSGDGWRFRGRGLFQITGQANYAAFAAVCPTAATEGPDWLATPAGAAESACWFWKRSGLNEYADGWQITAITTRINGPACLGLTERKRLCNAALAALSKGS